MSQPSSHPEISTNFKQQKPDCGSASQRFPVRLVMTYNKSTIYNAHASSQSKTSAVHNGWGEKSKRAPDLQFVFLLAAVSSPATPCLLTWQHVMLCQVLSPKKTRWTERSEKHAHKGMWTAFSLWLCFNQSQMQLQSENTSDLFKQQWTLALSKTCRIGGVEGID